MSLLVEKALEFARTLLELAGDDELGAPYLDQLALLAVRWMSRDVAHDRRAEWGADSELMPFARALATWSDARRVAADRDEADRLFALAARPSLRQRPNQSGYGRALNLLDTALAEHVGDAATLGHISRLWDSAVQRFQAHRVDFRRAHLLIDAASGNVAAADEIQADPALRGSAVARKLS
jgi:hypothetical protein